MKKEKNKRPGTKQEPQVSFNLVSTSGKKIRVSPPGGLDKKGNTCYTKYTMATKISQQLRNPDEKLWRQVRAAAIMEGKTMTRWVEEACRKQLALTKKSKKEDG
jgi:hypothetical protein